MKPKEILTRKEFISQRTHDIIINGGTPPSLEEFGADVTWTKILTRNNFELDTEAEYNAIWDSEYQLYLEMEDET